MIPHLRIFVELRLATAVMVMNLNEKDLYNEKVLHGEKNFQRGKSSLENPGRFYRRNN